MENKSKQLIIDTVKDKYGTINNFVESNYSKLFISRTHLYQLLNYKISNPGVMTLSQLASILELNLTEVVEDYYKNEKGKENNDTNEQ